MSLLDNRATVPRLHSLQLLDLRVLEVQGESS
jgi:hypothetical protein